MVGIDRPEWFDVEQLYIQILAAIWSIVMGLLMVSNARYLSFKELDSRRVPFIVLPTVVFVLGVVIYDIPLGVLTLSTLYVLSGLWTTFFSQD